MCTSETIDVAQRGPQAGVSASQFRRERTKVEFGLRRVVELEELEWRSPHSVAVTSPASTWARAPDGHCSITAISPNCCGDVRFSHGFPGISVGFTGVLRC